jgi:hypothetical protein
MSLEKHKALAAVSASARWVGYRMAMWYKPVVPGGGDPPRLSQEFRPMW